MSMFIKEPVPNEHVHKRTGPKRTNQKRGVVAIEKRKKKHDYHNRNSVFLTCNDNFHAI